MHHGFCLVRVFYEFQYYWAVWRGVRFEVGFDRVHSLHKSLLAHVEIDGRVVFSYDPARW